MTRLQDPRPGDVRTHEARVHPRRKLRPIAYVELGQDNGGILLNVSEGGLRVQSALVLTAREFPQLRFQLPNVQGWLTASGQMAWLSESKKEAGIQFLDLPVEVRAQIHAWTASAENAEVAPTVPADGGYRELRTPASGVETYRGEVKRESRPPAQGDAGAARSWAVAPLGSETSGASGIPAASQAFRFTDYSMFAADPEPQVVWKPVARRRGWGGAALAVVLLAVVFFVLGAAVGRDTLNYWLGYIVYGKQAPKEPSASEERPSTEAASGAAVSPDAAQPQATTTTLPQGAQTEQNASQEQKEQPPASGEATGTTETESAVRAAGGDSAAANANTASRGAEQLSAAAPKTSRRVPDVETTSDAASMPAHSILVTAPGPGSPPFTVNFPNEAVSASSSAAISVRRSIRVASRPGLYGRSERVVMGQLISHSDPFYPAEARSRRIEGSVELRALVGRTGAILSVTPVSGPALLSAAAINAVREWRYEPTYIDGDPAETQADITVVFRLR
jgi:TonB family protein